MIAHRFDTRLRASLPLLLQLILLGLCFHLFVSAVQAQTNAESQRINRAKPPAPPEVSGAAQGASAQSATARPVAQKYFTDVTLLNQDGQPVRFYSDLIKGKVVVINAFFATCQGSCLPMNRNLEKVQEIFRDRMGKDLFIISISVDPEKDTPASLREYAKRLNAVPGRLFITGKKENVDWALYKLGQYVEQKDQHTNIFIVGNERTGLWKKVFGLAKADEIVKAVEGVLNDKGAEGDATK
jgi:protein SCO1